MITLHLEAESPEEMISNVKRLFSLTESSTVVLDEPINTTHIITTEDLKAQLAAETVTAESTPKKTRAKKGETAEIKAAIVGKPDETPAAAPAFLSEEKATEAAPEVSLDTMREVAHQLAGTEGKGMPAVAEVLKTFKDDKGAPCVKMSQVQPADRAKAVAAFEAAMKG